MSPGAALWGWSGRVPFGKGSERDRPAHSGQLTEGGPRLQPPPLTGRLA